MFAKNQICHLSFVFVPYCISSILERTSYKSIVSRKFPQFQRNSFYAHFHFLFYAPDKIIHLPVFLYVVFNLVRWFRWKINYTDRLFERFTRRLNTRDWSFGQNWNSHSSLKKMIYVSIHQKPNQDRPMWHRFKRLR